jgi:FeS assembly protein IscX
MAIMWTDTLDIAIALDETYPDVDPEKPCQFCRSATPWVIAIALDETYPDADPRRVNFVDLMQLGAGTAGFRRRPRPRTGEKILEAIQMAWLEEREE